MAIYDLVQQFFMFKTGDGIESQEWVLKSGIQSMMPGQLHAYLEARQQHNTIRFGESEYGGACDDGGMLSLLGIAAIVELACGAALASGMEAVLPGHGAVGTGGQRHHLRHLLQSA